MKKRVVTPAYYKEHKCKSCSGITSQASIKWEAYSSDNCILVNIECSHCKGHETRLATKEEYLEHVVNGEYLQSLKNAH